MLSCFLAVALALSGIGWADSPPAQNEMRGIWVTRWTYTSEVDVRRIMAEVAAAGFNAVFFQVRGQHDAFYASKLEPWAAELSGTLGHDPGWDPLKIAVESGHAHGLHVHAYINAFPLWRGDTAPVTSQPMHAWLEHPDWLVANREGTPMALNEQYVFASPGNPRVRERLASVAQDIADRYRVDGIHLDYIRYPGAESGFDVASLADWEAQGRTDFSTWRRHAVTSSVASVARAVSVPVSAAVWGVYKNRWGWADVSEGFNDYFQDAAQFTGEGHADALIPMIYWTVRPGERLDFELLVKDHMSRANGRHVYAGVRAHPSWSVAEIEETIRAARRQGAHGIVVFEYSEARHLFDRLREGVFAHPARPPAMEWR